MNNNQGEEFKQKLNIAIDRYLESKDWESILMLKKAIAPVNNLITIGLTEKFIELLCSCGFIDEAQFKEMSRGTNANANGFDICHNGEKRIIAEVKGTLPYGGNRYGANQKDSIKKDIEYLTVPGAKTKVGKIDLFQYYRFMVMLKSQEGDKDIEAMQNLLKGEKIEYQILNDVDAKEIKLNVLNIVFVSLE